MKYLSIDLGQKRIGIATSDSKGIIAEPLTIIKRASDDKALEQIGKICKEKNIEKVVLGFPVTADEDIQNRYKSFAEKITKATSLPVDLWDETFSTKQAQNVVAFSDIGDSRKRTQTHRDDVAAAIILQEYLDHEENH